MAQLRRDRQHIPRCQSERLMRQLGLCGAVRGKVKRTTIPSTARRPEDLLQRQSEAPAPTRLWVADLTYVWRWSCRVRSDHIGEPGVIVLVAAERPLMPLTAPAPRDRLGRRYTCRSVRGPRMLASLLPGIRDLRTPLTVGYLWLLNFWLWFADHMPRARPESDGLLGRAFDLGDLLGPAFSLASLSFTAYVIGALVLVPIEGRLGESLLAAAPRKLVPEEARDTKKQYEDRLAADFEVALTRFSGLPPDELSRMTEDLERAARAGVGELRPRLLVANQHLYGEYDRLAAESAFRVNIAPPILALGVTLAAQVNPWLALPVLAVVLGLVYQALTRGAQAISVIQRAVISETFKHPVRSFLRS